MTQANEPSFPHNFQEQFNPGLTKREYFAAMALQGLLAKADYAPADIARFSIQAADELIKALNND